MHYQLLQGFDWFSTRKILLKNSVDMSVLTRYYRGNSWIKNLLRGSKTKRSPNLKQPLLAGGCFFIDMNNFWWSCRESRPGPTGNWLLVYKLSYF